MRKFITLFSFIVLFLSIAHDVLAVSPQLDNTSSSNNQSLGFFRISLGQNNVDQYISSFDFYVQSGSSAPFDLTLSQCSVDVYDSNCVNFRALSSLGVNTDLVVSTTSSSPQFLSFVPLDWVSDGEFGSFNGSGVLLLDKDSFWFLQLDTVNSDLFRVFGSSSGVRNFQSPSSTTNTTPVLRPYLDFNAENCFDGLLNQNETSVDWGGVCDTMSYFSDMNPSHQVSTNATLTDNDDEIVVVSSSGIVSGMIVASFGIPFNTFVGTVNGTTISLIDSNSDPVLATESGVVAVDFVDVVDPDGAVFDVTVNIDPSEFESGMELCMYFANDGVDLSGDLFTDAWVSVAPDQCFDLVSGVNVISSSSIQFENFSGLSTVTYNVFKPTYLSSIPVLGWLFDDSSFLRTDIRYALSELSQLDIARTEGNLGATLLSNVGLNKIGACAIATFDLGDCVKGLFLPTKEQLMQVWCTFQVGKDYVTGAGCSGNRTLFGGVLNVWPLGYITRFIDVIVTSAPVMPPALSYTFGSSVSSTGLTGETITYQIYDHFDVLESIESDQGSNSNIWDIFMPYWEIVVNLALFVAIFMKLIATDFNFGVSSGRSSGGRKPDSKSVQDVKSRYPQLKNYE